MADTKDRHHKMLDKVQIVQVALEILQKEGIKSITVRNIAEKLNIKSASLYWHIKNKNELLGLLADEISKAISFPDDSLPWEEQFMELAIELRKVLLTIRDSAVVLTETPPASPYRIEVIRRLNGIFEGAGMKPDDVFSSAWLFNNYVVSFVLEEYRFMEIGREAEAGTAQMDIPPVDLPMPDLNKEFRFGLEVIVAGLKEKTGVSN